MARPSKIRAWLQLVRIANLPTAISNVVAGYAITNVEWELESAAALVLISCLLYCGGMVLNDAFDVEADIIERPLRPIPSNVIDRSLAFFAGFSMLSTALILASWLEGESWSRWLPFAIASLLAISILLYDTVLKTTWLGPVLMGTCRSLNILLGCSTGSLFFWAPDTGWFVAGSTATTYAMLIGCYIAGVTLLAKKESSKRQSRLVLTLAATVIVASLAAIACLTVVNEIIFHKKWSTTFSAIDLPTAVLVGMVALPVLRRLYIAVRSAKPEDVGTAVVTSLTSLILLDAVVLFLARREQPLYAGALALLVIPVIALRRVSAQT